MDEARNFPISRERNGLRESDDLPRNNQFDIDCWMDVNVPFLCAALKP